MRLTIKKSMTHLSNHTLATLLQRVEALLQALEHLSGDQESDEVMVVGAKIGKKTNPLSATAAWSRSYRLLCARDASAAVEPAGLLSQSAYFDFPAAGAAGFWGMGRSGPATVFLPEKRRRKDGDVISSSRRIERK